MPSDPFGTNPTPDENSSPGWGQAPPPPGASPPPPAWGTPPPGAAPPSPQYQQYGGVPTYGAPANPYESRSTTILVLGILGLVFCQLLAPVAWIMGRNVAAEAAGAGWPEPGNNKAGRICGLIGTILIGVSILLLVLFIAIGVAAGGSSSGY